MVLKVNTTNFQSTAGKSYRQPVNTFVEPVQVQPRTGMMDLAQSLATVNPVIQKYLSNVIEQEKQRGILEGQNKILSSTPEDINKIKKELEEKGGKRFARNFVGGNMYTQYGIEKQIAINLGNASKAKTKKFFDEYVVQFETKDGVVPMSLSQFDINSKEFKQALSDFNETQLLDTKGIRPNILNEHFFPNQNIALQEVYAKHQEKRADAKIDIFENSFSDSILINFRSINEDNDDINDRSNKLKTIEDSMQDLVNRGLPESVSPKKIVEYTKRNINSIISDFEEGEMDWIEAQAEIYDLIDFVKELKVGPRNFNKKGDLIQSTLGDFTDKDGSFNEVLKDAYKIINDKREEEVKLADFSEQKDIDTRLSQLDYNKLDINTIKNNANIISNLTTDYPDQIEFIKEKYADLNYNVDAWFLNFHKRYNNGEFKDKRQARTTLYGFMESLGPSATKEDLANFNRLMTYVDKESNKGLFESRPELKRLIKFGDKTLSQRGLFTMEVKGQYVQQKYDLDEDFRKELDKWSIGIYKSDKEKEAAYELLLKNYRLDLRNIKSGKYEFKNPDNKIFDLTSYEGEDKAESIIDKLEFGAFSEGGNTTVDVSSGDTLSGISNDFGIPMKAIMKANGITNANQIDVGDTLLIPEGVDYTNLNNINFVENLDKTKIISEKDHPYAPVRREHNFKVIFDLAKAEGIKFPELVAAQAMHESTWGDDKSSENNFLGIKATTAEIARGESERKNTTEDRGKGLQPEKADFKKFENLEEMIRQYKIQWNDNFQGRKGTVNADTVLEALKLIKAGDYATDEDYVTKVMDLLDGAKTLGWY
mgnify:CR=1 FL=1